MLILRRHLNYICYGMILEIDVFVLRSVSVLTCLFDDAFSTIYVSEFQRLTFLFLTL